MTHSFLLSRLLYGQSRQTSFNLLGSVASAPKAQLEPAFMEKTRRGTGADAMQRLLLAVVLLVVLPAHGAADDISGDDLVYSEVIFASTYSHARC